MGTQPSCIQRELTSVNRKLAGFQKKYFWFGDEAVDPKHLSSYLRGEKAEVANHNAAWSSHTGKGLLYFSKHSSEKATPAGIINLVSIALRFDMMHHVYVSFGI